MRVDPKKITDLMGQRGISPERLTLDTHITPVYWAKIMRTGDCCEENALAIADILNVPLEDII